MTRRNRLAAWPLRHSFGAAMVAVLIALAGFAALGRLPLDYPPASAGTRWYVRVSAPAMGLPFLDAQLAQPLARELAAVPGVTATETSVRAGEVTVELRFASVSRRDAAREELTQRLARLQSALPLKYARIGIADRRPAPTQVLELAVSLEGRDAPAVRAWAEETLVPSLAGVPGVAEVALHGAGGREVQVVPDQRRLAGLGLSIADLLETFDNAVREGPLLSLAAVEALPVRLAGGENIQLSEVAQVTAGEATAAPRLWFDGRPGLVLSVSRQPQANAAEVGRRVKAQLAWLQANGQIPADARTDFLADDAGTIGVSLARMATAALTGLALIALLLVLVLRRLRPVIYICAALLLAGLTVFLLLAAMRHPLNVMALGGWMLALGMGAAGSLWLWQTATRRAPPTAAALRQGVILAAVFVAALAGLLASFVSFAEQADMPYGQAALAALVTVVATLVFAWLLAPVFAVGNPVTPLRRHPFIRRWPQAVRALTPPAGVLLPALAAAAFLFLSSRYAVSDEAVRVRVEGPDTTQAVRLGYALLTRLQSVPGLGALQHSAGGAREDVAVVLDAARAAERQVELADVAQVIGLAVGGRVVGRLVEQGQSSPIRLRLVPEAGGRAEALARLLLRGETRQRPAVYVRDVATLQPVTTPATIRYRNGSAMVELSGNVLAGYSPDAVRRQVQEALRAASLPKDYQARLETPADDGTDYGRYLVALVAGMVLVVAAWAAYARSWRALARRLPLTLLVFGVSAVCLWFAGPLLTPARALALGFVFAVVAGQVFLFVDTTRDSSPALAAWLVIAAVAPLAWWGGPLLSSMREAAATLAAGAAVSALVLQALAPWRQRIARRERRP